MLHKLLPTRTGMATRYPIIIILVILTATCINALILNKVITSNSRDFQVIVQQKQKEYLTHKAEWILYDIKKSAQGIAPSRALSNSQMFTIEKPVGLYIFSRTSDDNYYRLSEVVKANPELAATFRKGTTLSEERSGEIIRRGLTEISVDTEIRSKNGHAWQNVFFPLPGEKKNHVVMMQSPAYNVLAILRKFEESSHAMKIRVLIITSISMVVVIFLVLLFTHNIHMFVDNLSGSIRKAAEGDFSVKLNPDSDRDFSELATSFNTLIEELRSREKNFEELTQKDYLSDIFKMAVSKLKASHIEDAITLFNAVIILKPDSFGSFFNLGVAYARTREYEKSAAMFNRAREINPEHQLTMSYIEKIKAIREKNKSRA
ncbi:MAG: HAMP domain-containing protein [Spirochaetota bacterium]